jgi:hypothetical protein
MKWVGWTWVCGSYRLEAEQAFYILHLGEEGAGQVGAAYIVLCNEVIVGTDLSAVITWVGLGLCAAEPHHFSSCVRVN